MGKSASCFKIITCGTDSVQNNDAIDVPQNKISSDKKGWSFRKRSERHRVLSNTVIQEAASGVKETPESSGYIQQSDVSVAPEKITAAVQYTEEKPQLLSPKEFVKEKSQLLTLEDSKVSEPVVASTSEANDDTNMDESVVLVIQTAIRGFLAQKELGKLKNLVKLQAAVRGHLVRRHAAGTLRCIQAIVKMQVLVRARHVRLSQEGSYVEKKLNDENQKGSQSLHGNSATKKNASSTSIEKLLSNRFASQLMDSTSKTKPIHINCDPSKSSSAWSWLERWMSVSFEKAPIAELPIEPKREKSDNCDSPLDTKFQSKAISESNDAKSDVSKTLVSTGSEENLITYDAAKSKFEACQPTSSVTGDLDQSQIEIMSTCDMRETSLDQTMQTDAHSQTDAGCLPNKPEIESEQPERSMKSVASEELEAEAKKSISGSRKASNMAFIAAQTKFAELSSTANSSRSIDSSHEDVGVESNLNTASSGADTISRSNEPSTTENPVISNCKGQHGGSESGNELSVTSTLDSPDRSEVGTKENDTITMPVPDSSLSIADQPKNFDDTIGESGNLIVVGSSQLVQEPASNLLREQDSDKGNQECRSSPEASHRSHMTIPESQGTPSSQVLVKTKKKTVKSSQKRKSLTTAKGSPSTATLDSGVSSSIEQLSKDKKYGKRRNSFDSTRPENNDEEPRDTNTSNNVPRFMQATESARAKVNANNSPRSSPDVQDKYIKKRHSLTGANGKQSSPRIQLSPSQAQQGAKENETNPLNDRKWQR